MSGIDSLVAYDAYLNYIRSAINIFGQQISFFVPNRESFYGYENIDKAKEEATGVPNIATSYKAYQTKAFIDFTLCRSIMNRFSWFPEDSDKYCILYTTPNDLITQETIVRTSTPGDISSWGDMMFSVYRIFDDGLYKTLSRSIILVPISSQELNVLLSPDRYQDKIRIV